ncbi:MAG: tetratricopeptide repeat protein [Aureispira sp.]|nr:tetratricopeptide repeat protein [Aureispira sp.]
MPNFFYYLFFYFVYLLSNNSQIHAQILSNHEVDSINDLAWAISEQDVTLAKTYSLQALKAAKNLDYWYGEANAYSQLGLIYDMLGQADQALEYHFKALSIEETHKDSIMMAYSHCNIGAVYYLQNDLENALKYYNSYLDIALHKRDTLELANAYLNIAVVYKAQDSIEQALSLYQKTLSYYKALNHIPGVLSSTANIANIYTEQKKYDLASEYYNLVLDSLENHSSIQLELNLSNALANFYLSQNKAEQALPYALKNIKLAQESNQLERLQFAYSTVAETYEQLNKKNLALSYYKKYNNLRDTILNKERQEKISNLETVYQIEKKDRQLAEAALQKKQAELNYQYQRSLFLGIILSILVLASFILYRNINNRQINKILRAKNITIEENLVEKDGLLKEKEVLLGEIHHRVKNNLELISSILELQGYHLKDEQAINAIKDSQKRVEAVALLHQRLYQRDDFKGIQIQEYLEELVEDISDLYDEDQSITINTTIDKLFLDIDSSIPLGLLVTELLTNAFKYAFPNKTSGEINVILTQHKDHLNLIIQDNGIGIQKTANHKNATNFGMQLATALAQQLKADMTINSENGTSITLKIKRFTLAQDSNR